ncbi:transcription antitermination factor NusB [Buchnera aphidicola]|uniref:Transcription antitermination protein NusB n=1 Tax=Buchnera aphidicola subsp. Cinara cedri (strain Cc) TaxID=372461 RepID=NUSB_BUCCC|nr:transcription antitermination factor NusB [Buchnera aphidicola]Q057F3.1 RecName: Full=Transcription antitermination protein NusB; AltName: Full=Antitermination factor NusB [Buchnera aphidicola BCc]ABJ90746.1 transcription termination [Buchnera aphidicola BCc]
MKSKRRKARELAIQVLYSWQISKKIVLFETEKYVIEQNKKYSLDKIYFHKIVTGVIKNIFYIDKIIKKNISKKKNRLDYIEQAILRLASYEIIKRLDIPYKVIINEGIELAKIYGSNKSHKFINSILDKIITNKNNIKIKNF